MADAKYRCKNCDSIRKSEVVTSKGPVRILELTYDCGSKLIIEHSNAYWKPSWQIKCSKKF